MEPVDMEFEIMVSDILRANIWWYTGLSKTSVDWQAVRRDDVGLQP